MIATSLSDRFYSDKFLFWSAIFIVVAFLLCFILGIFLGIFLKNAKELKEHEHFDALFGLSVFQGIDFVTFLFYMGNFAHGSRDKIEAVGICFLLAFFVGSFLMITPICIWLFYFVNEVFVLLGLLPGLIIKNIVGCISRKKSA